MTDSPQIPSGTPAERLREEQKLEAVGLLAAGIAHDFNNLLTIINGYQDIVLSSPDLPVEVRKSLNAARGAGTRAVSLIRGLLTLGRRMALEPGVMDLNEAVREVSALAEPLLPSHIRFRTEVEPLPQLVRADAGGIQQVRLNLINNSRDAMARGGELVIRTESLDVDLGNPPGPLPLPAGRYVVLSVSDTGDGMSKEIQRRIFEPFFTTKGRGGSGLGLAMVQHIVSESGGILDVESAPGRGSTFHIYLPCYSGLISGASGETGEVPNGRQETILLVESHRDLRLLLSSLLQRLNYTVLVAESAAEATEVRRGRLEDVDLLVVDAMLPDCTGAELAARLRAWQRDLSVLQLPGDGEDPHPEGEVLVKPFSLSAFRWRVRQVLDRKQTKRILVVDDDPNILLIAGRALRDEGFEVLVAGDGRVAMETAQTERLDLVITDLVMPDREGLETIIRLRKSCPALPVIAMSGAFGGDFLKGAVTLGACATLAKPFSNDELVSAVRAALMRR